MSIQAQKQFIYCNIITVTINLQIIHIPRMPPANRMSSRGSA